MEESSSSQQPANVDDNGSPAAIDAIGNCDDADDNPNPAGHTAVGNGVDADA